MYKTDLYTMYIKNSKYEIININEEFIYKINNETEKIMKLIEEEIAIEKIIKEIEEEKEKKRKIVNKSFLIIPILGGIVLLIAISVFIIYVYKNKSTKSLSIYTIENIS